MALGGAGGARKRCSKSGVWAVQGYREENKTGFAIEGNKYKAAFVSLDIGAIYTTPFFRQYPQRAE